MDEFTGTLRHRCSGLLVWCVVLFAGCEHLGTTKKFKNPVVPPPPQRMLARDGEDNEGAEDTARLAGSNTGEVGRQGSSGSSLAAPEPRRRLTERPTAPQAASRQPRSTSGKAVASADAASGPEAEVAQASATAVAGQTGWRAGGASRRPPVADGSLPPSSERQRELTSAQTTAEADVGSFRIEHGEVAAFVDGQPIFVNDVLQDYRITQAFEQARRRGVPPEEIRAARRKMVEQRLDHYIDQELLVQEFQRKIPEDHLEKAIKSIDAQFDKEGLPQLIKDTGASTAGELEVKLREIGRSIEGERLKSRKMQMAQQYVAMTAKPHSGFDHPDIVKHYQENEEKFLVRGEVKWQQIRLSYAKHGGDRARTMKLAREIMQRLQAGEDFGELAKKYSDGPTAAKGGIWDNWTTEGSVASADLDKALFEMPVSDELGLIETDKSIDIVVVLDRHDRGLKSFHSVQQDIANQLKQAEVHKNVKALLEELRAKANIEKFTDRL